MVAQSKIGYVEAITRMIILVHILPSTGHQLWKAASHNVWKSQSAKAQVVSFCLFFLPVFFFLSGLNRKHKKNVGLSWEKVTTQWLCCRWFNKHNTLDFLDTKLLHSVFIHYNFLSQSSMHDSRKGVFLATELIFVANMFSTK